MRLFLLSLIVVCVGYVYFDQRSDTQKFDGGFRMPELEAPVQIGTYTETDRPDLFVPVSSNSDYYVPEDVVNAATFHELDGRRWFSYRPEISREAYPVVMLFHGAGRDGLSMIDMWRDVADQEGLFLIALDGWRQNWSFETVYPTILHEILASSGKIAPLDLNRVYLFGHSNGAKYVQSLINQTEGPWRAAAVHGGFSDPARAIVPADPKPIRFYIGSRDHIFEPDVARYVGIGLTERGHPVDLQLIPNHTHWFYDAGPTIAADAWAWLIRQ